MTLVDLLAQYGTQALLSAIDQLCRVDLSEITVSTAHRAKGREWPTVRIAEDFSPPLPRTHPPKPVPGPRLYRRRTRTTRLRGRHQNTNPPKPRRLVLNREPTRTSPAPQRCINVLRAEDRRHVQTTSTHPRHTGYDGARLVLNEELPLPRPTRPGRSRRAYRCHQPEVSRPMARAGRLPTVAVLAQYQRW